MRRVLLFAVVLFVALLLTGCGTMSRLGRDVLGAFESTRSSSDFVCQSTFRKVPYSQRFERFERCWNTKPSERF